MVVVGGGVIIFFSRLSGELLGGGEQGGTTGKENLGWGKEGELRTPLQASEQVWTVLQLVHAHTESPKPQESEHSDYSPLLSSPAGMRMQRSRS